MYELFRDALPYLFAFYVFDGLVFAAPGELVLARAWRTFQARRGGLQLAGTWPTNEAVRTSDPPVIVTPRGFHAAPSSAWFPVPRADELTFHAFEASSRARRDGRKAVYGTKAVWTAPSEGAAESAVSLLRAVSEAPEERRLAALETWLKAAGDLERVRARGALYAKGARARRVVASLLFGALFVAVPGLLALGPEEVGTGLEIAALAIVVLHVTAVVLTRRALRRVPHVAPGTALASLALFPPSAAHAPLAVTKDLYADCHPLAVAAVLLPAGAFAALAHRERHRLDVAREAARGGETEDYWRLQIEALERIAAAANADVRHLKAAPARVDADAAAYCPLCFGEYRPGILSCADCDATLRSF